MEQEQLTSFIERLNAIGEVASYHIQAFLCLFNVSNIENMGSPGDKAIVLPYSYGKATSI